MRAEEVSPSSSNRLARQVFGAQDAGPLRIVNVVVHVRREVGDTHNLPFERFRSLGRRHADRGSALALRVMRDAVTHFPGQVQPVAIVFEHIDDPEALLIVVESAGNELVEHALARVPERRVPEIVAKRDRLGELLVQLQHLRDGPRDLRDLERVRQPGAIVIAGWSEEHLSLVLQTPERLRVHNAVAVALK